jgi:hypothetical protein
MIGENNTNVSSSCKKVIGSQNKRQKKIKKDGIKNITSSLYSEKEIPLTILYWHISQLGCGTYELVGRINLEKNIILKKATHLLHLVIHLQVRGQSSSHLGLVEI